MEFLPEEDISLLNQNIGAWELLEAARNRVAERLNASFRPAPARVFVVSIFEHVLCFACLGRQPDGPRVVFLTDASFALARTFAALSDRPVTEDEARWLLSPENTRWEYNWRNDNEDYRALCAELDARAKERA
jgi:hypothetical protein